MPKKWYNYIVSVDETAGTGQSPPNAPPNSKNAPAGAKSAAQSVAEIASSMGAEPKFTTPVSDPTSFDEIYTLSLHDALPIYLAGESSSF